ncbi:MAG: right-handed parallel beta-helix repeat-containing protein [Roseobacter sp.]
MIRTIPFLRSLLPTILVASVSMTTQVLAANQAGPWCVGVLETLGGHQMARPDIARHVIDQQTPPDVTENPLRLVYVSSQASQAGDGTRDYPFRVLQNAVNNARPGDKIIVAPGNYEPAVIKISGTADAPIILAAQNEGSNQAVIDGKGKKVRGLIEIREASHITVSGFRLQNAARDGVFVEGTIEGERDIRILNNDIDTTGNSAIFVGGIVMRFITEVDEYRLFDVLIQGNRITNTNTPKGVNEAISLGGGVDGFTIRNNYIYDSRQYGIDAKAGAINGTITDNTIHGIERHGIYVDTGSRTVANIDIHRNAVFGVRNGIVMAREANRDPEHPNLFNINVSDNLVFDVEQFGIMAYRHPDDSGIGRFDDIAIAGNCICDIKRDAVRLGGIGDFAKNISVADNFIMSSGGRVRNKIGAEVQDDKKRAGNLSCPS